ncbi:MAG: hypothetical protein A2W91_12925 [Bacteroidetes bacterium GWF2_38_335]|nr:MAG: hypothetical protein A2W91_12925 [Bacteroidetes bacterium GWF2_38_335]HBS86928.1 hypothetical protein [Bacteroidales bacterium]
MKINRIKIKCVAILFFVSSFCNKSFCQECLYKVDYLDSISVINFIKSNSLCKKIEYVNSNLYDFIEDNGYSELILFNISSETKRGITIPIGKNEGGFYSKKEKRDNLKKQFEAIYFDFCLFPRKE